ncbi:NADPH:quinone reductase-like Zn-dependent oxidoreductase [Flavimobilis soli]|uniref:NADPH:quinone reductase-like Zn-dependent oxidoreductase n=1 Tax=Flavimobilis soli TaxID=442709 RepID=A0A2A9EGA1_9MICO|nr:zinc-binding dehydrogenase [Flavimobilis soli]PFG37295.1 NADPH:quinone reductase-like Zn-dependent oxidoreductase [Flavimobilis soli]
MLAAYAASTSPTDPLSGLVVGERPAPEPRESWTVVDVRAASLNHHDLWSLRGVGLPDEALPMILGTDAAGVTPDGREVVVHGVIGADGHGVGPRERRTLLSEKYPGTLAEQVAVPTANLIDKPASLSFAEAACLPTAWLTAYSLLFRAADLRPGNSVLVQGAGGGVSSAAIALGVAAGLEVFATSRSAEKRERAAALGATTLEPGARLPRKVDAVVETVGRATWAHSAASVRPGGTIAVAGATTGDADAAQLTRIFFQEIRVQGVTMGRREDLAALLAFLGAHDLRPTIALEVPLAETARGIELLAEGTHFGKVVVLP